MFALQVKNFATSFDQLLSCCRSLTTNRSLKNFLFLTLRVGNYLNLVSPRGKRQERQLVSIGSVRLRGRRAGRRPASASAA